MKKNTYPLLAAALLLILNGCAKQTTLIRWDAPLIDSVTSTAPVTYWDNGDQCFLISTDNLNVSLSGFISAKYLVIVLAMKNTSPELLHFYPQECLVSQPQKKTERKVYPIRPKDLDEAARNFMVSTTALSVLNLVLTGNQAASEEIQFNQRMVMQGYASDKAELAKNHTLFPDSYFSGYLFFNQSATGILDDAVDLTKPFKIHFTCGVDHFSVTGRLPRDDEYDGTESPEVLGRIVFFIDHSESVEP